MSANNFFSILIVLCTTMTSVALADDFRKNSWGDNKAAVISTAGKPVHNTDDQLLYNVSIGNLDAFLFYDFVNNKLTSAGYVFAEKHSNKTMFISDFAKINELLKRKYGNPIDDKSVWYDDLYQDDPSDYGMAVSIGHHAKQTIWETERTKIKHTLRGDNYEIIHGINYDGKELESLVEEVTEKEAMEQL